MMREVLYEGKSKVVCAGEDRDSLIIRYKDTATAFNGVKQAELFGKGKLNAAISNLIYEHLQENGIKTHLIKVIDDTTSLVKKAEIIMVEVIVRNVAAGSFSKKYGIPEGTLLKNVSVEFSVKSDELGDPMINISQITAIGICTAHELTEMIEQSLRINELLCELFKKAGIRLIDFKLEFGRDLSETSDRGKIILCDEISPDSCRLWDMKSGKKLDKDRFRRDMGGVLDSYRDVLQRLTEINNN
ncbi:MAG: phosphoribosylaminoimidazolesuccinocarboxamide synthase [Oscillospiraceae bacterium]|nr:phosphoribosylaminoimidazolesuccinocarboxamide synthase [Oscillospiraceae bacterium]